MCSLDLNYWKPSELKSEQNEICQDHILSEDERVRFIEVR